MALPRFIAVPAVRASQRFFGLFGFDLVDYRPSNRDIRDVELYRPMFSPWLSPEWRKTLRADDARSLLTPQARYNLFSLALVATRRCEGDLAECGVYKGGTARILAELEPNRPLHLFDTFDGMPETDPKRDLHKARRLRGYERSIGAGVSLGSANVKIEVGLIPDSLRSVGDRAFSFVHIDLDIYNAIKSASEFFYPRMVSGGILLFDDYGFPSCPGARAAVDEFFADKPEAV
jgi:O-methyltransferase